MIRGMSKVNNNIVLGKYLRGSYSARVIRDECACRLTLQTRTVRIVGAARGYFACAPHTCLLPF